MAKNAKLSLADKKIVICISGMAGTGKSTLSKRLAEKYNLKCYSGGDALKELAKAEGYDVSCQGWWESPEGLNFLNERVNDPKFDKAVDAELLKYAKQGNVLLDSWTMPWLLRDAFKIWLETDVNVRTKRATKRDDLTFDDALIRVKLKDEQTQTIYKKLYGFNLGKDFEPFDFILDTNDLEAEEVFQTVCAVVDNIVLKK